eukprot:SAG11_NODE_32104_length_286_cov_1.005348_1_plen_34_part_01
MQKAMHVQMRAELRIHDSNIPRARARDPPPPPPP